MEIRNHNTFLLLFLEIKVNPRALKGVEYPRSSSSPSPSAINHGFSAAALLDGNHKW